MPRLGLNRQTTLEAIIRLIEEKGCQAFSSREMAKRLSVQASSLYNHVGNQDEILAGVDGANMVPHHPGLNEMTQTKRR